MNSFNFYMHLLFLSSYHIYFKSYMNFYT